MANFAKQTTPKNKKKTGTLSDVMRAMVQTIAGDDEYAAYVAVCTALESMYAGEARVRKLFEDLEAAASADTKAVIDSYDEIVPEATWSGKPVNMAEIEANATTDDNNNDAGNGTTQTFWQTMRMRTRVGL